MLLECIGRGGMAEVFRAVAQGVEGFQRVFVVKRIQREQADNPALVEMFANEARISALLNHPNIVQVYDFGQLDGSYFISMEYLRGKDLLAVLRQLRAAGRLMTPALVASIARDVARGLDYAHNLQAPGGKGLDIVHRDISPSNVMLLRAGGVKLLDFGIAKASAVLRDTKAGHTTATGMVKGKLSYLSPEQVRHEVLDARSDIFSLGVVLWECLTGKRLFHDRSDYHTMNNVLTRMIPAPSTQNPGVPAALDALVLRALERERGKRIPSARVLADELEHFLASNPVSPRALPTLLDELFGPEKTELEAVPEVDPNQLAPDADTPVMTAVMLPSIPSITAITGTASRSDHLLPASSPTAARPGARTGARIWPWAVGAVFVAGAFAAGRLIRPATNPAVMGELGEGREPSGAEGAAGSEAVVRALPEPVPALAPAPAPPAAPVQISVRVESDPPGAEVLGPGGASLGRTPLVATLPRGTAPVTLTVRKTGYESARQSLTPDRDVSAVVSLRAERETPEPVRGRAAPSARASGRPGRATREARVDSEAAAAPVAPAPAAEPPSPLPAEEPKAAPAAPATPAEAPAAPTPTPAPAAAPPGEPAPTPPAQNPPATEP